MASFWIEFNFEFQDMIARRMNSALPRGVRVDGIRVRSGLVRVQPLLAPVNLQAKIKP
jgi:hypothetical protein